MNNHHENSELDLTIKEVSDFLSKIPPGTIVFSRSKLGLNASTAIQLGQWSIWSHVFMCIDHGDIIETDLKNGARIVKLTEALKGVYEVEFLIPKNPISNVNELRDVAEEIVNSNKEKAKYGITTILAAGAFPILRAYSWGLTGSLTLLTMIGLSSATPLVLFSMVFGCGLFSVVEKYFGNQEETIKKMEGIYTALKLTNTKFGEMLSNEDHKLICSTLVQKMLQHSDSDLNSGWSLNRPKDLDSAVNKSDKYDKVLVKFEPKK